MDDAESAVKAAIEAFDPMRTMYPPPHDVVAERNELRVSVRELHDELARVKAERDDYHKKACEIADERDAANEKADRFEKIAKLAATNEHERIAAITKERDEWKEKACVLESQVENADSNLKQVRMAMKANHKREIEELTARAVEAERELVQPTQVHLLMHRGDSCDDVCLAFGTKESAEEAIPPRKDREYFVLTMPIQPDAASVAGLPGDGEGN